MDKAKIILSKFATPDIIIRRDFKSLKIEGTVLFHPDLTDGEVIRGIVAALERSGEKAVSLERLNETVLFASETEICPFNEELIGKLLYGDSLLFVEGFDQAIVINTKKWDKRAVAEPPTDVVINGPREGFTEDIKTNLSLIEKRLKSPSLAIVKLKIGRITGTNVAVIYLSNVAEKKVVDKIVKRLEKIDVDGIIDIHNIEPFIDDRPYSIFRQVFSTEKPDTIAAKLLEGRVAVMIDGSPMVLTLPFLMIEDFQASEDYYQRHSYSTFLRCLRYASVLFALYLPALYVTVQLFNYDILPMRLLITIMNAVKGTPLPPLLEMLFVIMLFEIIREASVRMPKAVGMAMSIVGALVLGETAVNAGIISSPSIMITALSSLALFLVPGQLPAFTLLRVVYTVIGGVLGIYGLILVTVYVIHYLANLDSYDTPQLAPFAPLILGDFKDALAKEPFSHMKKRPESIGNINKTRQA